MVSIVINDTEIKLSDDLILNFSIADIKDLTKRKGTWSTSFTIPATSTNNQALGHIYEFNIDDTDPKVYAIKARPKATLKVHNNTFKQGYAIIETILMNKTPIQYNGVFYCDNGNWITKLKNNNINTLDFGTTKMQRATVRSAQTTPTDYTFPLCDYGRWNGGLVGVDASDFRPAIFLPTLINKIFNQHGYTVKSTWINNSDIANIIVLFGAPMNKVPIASEELFDYNITTEQVIVEAPNDSMPTVETRIEFDNEVTDDPDLKNWSATAWEWTVKTDGNYTLDVQVDLTATLYNYSGTNDIQYKIKRDRDGEIEDLDTQNRTWSSNGSYSDTLQYVGDMLSDDIVYVVYDVIVDAINEPTGPDPSAKISLDSSSNIALTINYFNVKSRPIRLKESYKIQDTLPSIKQSDLMRWIQLSFNLMIDSDERNVYMEPRNDWVDTGASTVSGYYGSQVNALDWSAKLDRMQDVQIEYIDSYRKSMIFDHVIDDPYMKEQDQKLSKSWGEYETTLHDRFPNGDTKIRTGFGKTWRGYFTIGGDNHQILMPRIRREFTGSDIEQIDKFKPRLLTYKKTNENNRFGQSPEFRFYDDNLSTYATYTTDIPKAFDVNLDSPTDFQTIFDDYLDGVGLVNRYYLSTITDINDGTTLSGYFNLTYDDIVNLDFSELIYLDGTYWTLNSIEYNVTQSISKVVLVKYNQRPISFNGINAKTFQGTYGINTITFTPYSEGINTVNYGG